MSKREANCVPDDIFGYKEAEANGGRFYIAAQFKRGELLPEFTLGDGKYIVVMKILPWSQSHDTKCI